MIFPWLISTAGTCVATHTAYEYAGCTVGHGLLIGACMIIGALLSCFCIRFGQARLVYLSPLFQLFAVIGLLNMRSVAFLVGPIYVLALLAIANYKTTTKSLVISPFYTVAYLAVLFGLSETAQKAPLHWLPHYTLTKWMMYILPHTSGVWSVLPALFTLLIGLILLNVWKKVHSIPLCLFLTVSLVWLAFRILIHLSFRSVLNF